MDRKALLALAAALASCGAPAPDTRSDAARLRASFAEHRPAYAQAIELENRLVPETLEWLNGELAAPPGPRLGSQACRLMDRWAAAYFGPRVIHGKLRFDEYRSADVKRTQQQVLEHLRQRYFLLHEYQRYAQAACESGMGAAPAAGTRAGLEEFRRRLEVHPPARDEISAMLDALP